jgi:membrane-bound inhibitor of C-type lysozyme
MWRMLLRRRLVLVLALVLAAALASAAVARAELVTRQDAAGRTITFDVLDATADVDWYAGLLRNAAHGNEISTVTVRIVPYAEIRDRCGSNSAAACYLRRTITVPAGKSNSLAATVLHEYGHHLDTAWSVSGVQELNGTPVWWASRGMAALLASGTVAFDYSLGWDHSIAEVFAEDYSYIHTGAYYSIPWLSPPDDALKTALLAELGGATVTTSPTTAPAAPATPTVPVNVARSGTLSAGARGTIPFRLLGPGRHVTVTAAVSAIRRLQTGARIEVVCDGAVVQTKTVVGGKTATLDLPNLGPATCEAALVSTSTARQRYSVRLRLAIEA